MQMESLRFSWKEQQILLTICNAISVIWLGSLRRACVGCRLRGPGISLRLGSRTWEEPSVIFTSEVSQWFFSPISSSLHPRHSDAAAGPFSRLGRGEVGRSSSPCPPPRPRQPRGCLCPPTRPRENNSGSGLTEPSVSEAKLFLAREIALGRCIWPANCFNWLKRFRSVLQLFVQT